MLNKIELNNGFTRQGKIFQTINRSYFFDSGTAKVFECEEKELEILQIILNNEDAINTLESLNKSQYEKAANNILYLMREENILQMPYYQHVNSENIDDIVKGLTIEHFILELTQNCNLRCRYCVYNDSFESFRKFSNIDMTWDTAEKAFDFLYNHSSSEVVIGFYGGEPLLNFKLMKQCIDYCEHKFKDKKVLYAFTSNLTLLTNTMADYFNSLTNIQITCSLDGPQSIQDENRLTITGKGSFDKTIKGLKLLAKHFKEEKSVIKIMIHSVLCPPYSYTKFKTLKDFFESLDCLNNGIDLSYTYPSKGSFFGYKHIINPKFKGLSAVKEIDPIKYYALLDFLKTLNINGYSFKIIKNNLLKIHTLEISDEPQKKFYRNACCIPGKRKTYVTTDGKFKLCERLGDTPFIGDVKSGFDTVSLNYTYLKDYDTYSIKTCNNCWAIHMCPMCYAYCYGKNGLDKDKKDEYCQDYREIGIIDLIIYYHLLEEYPDVQYVLDDLLL